MKLFDYHDNIEVRETERYGKSLFAKRAFKKGEIVFVAAGKIVNYQTDYTIPISDELMIEPRTPEGNPAQFLCHSCEPNLGIQSRTLFVAMRDIQPGEEMRTHYAFLGYEFGQEKTENGKHKIKLDLTCKCGSENCAGFLRGYKDLSREEREKWKDYISEYLLTKE